MRQLDPSAFGGTGQLKEQACAEDTAWTARLLSEAGCLRTDLTADQASHLLFALSVSKPSTPWIPIAPCPSKRPRP